jgi:hypothetical protein
MEPSWTKSIPNWVVCDWFYVLFIISVVALAISFFFFITGMFYSKAGPMRYILTIGFFRVVLMIGISATSTLFYHLICSRALVQGKA